MLTKCANPNCSAQFLYLHEGKLFIVDRSNRMAGGCAQAGAADGQPNDYFDYYWLCANCSRKMVVVSDKWVPPQVVPLPHSHAEREQEFR